MIYKFLKALPDNIPKPDLCLDPDGEISLDWANDNRHYFSLSIGENKTKMPWACHRGDKNDHGVLEFDGETIPEFILSKIRECI